MISVIVPTFNRKALLHEAVRTLFGEGAHDFECVIVDDASTDGTREAVAELQERWGQERIVYLRQQENAVALAARNRGIVESKGEFLLFMDSDDLPCPEGMLDLRRHLESRPDLDYCFGRVQKTDANLKSLGEDEVVGAPFDNEPVEIAGYHWHTMGALYRRECVEKVGPWNIKLTGSQDWEYQARVKLCGGQGAFVETLVGHWRQHSGSRVGTNKFREDYVRSVMLSCDSVLALAGNVGRRDIRLEARIAKKLLVHAFEWGGDRYHKERQECIAQAQQSLTKPHYLSALLWCFSMMPSYLDGFFRKRLSKSS